MALRNRRNGNLDALTAFAGKFDPKLPITETRAVAGKAVTNGYMTAWHDPESGLGLTAVVWGGGRMKVWVEVDSEVGDADALGEFFADVIMAAVPQDGLEAEEKAWDVQLAAEGSQVEDLKQITQITQTAADGQTCVQCGSDNFIMTDRGKACGICGKLVTFLINDKLYTVQPLIQQDMEGASSIVNIDHSKGRPFQPPQTIVDEDNRQAEPAGLVSDRMAAQSAEFPNPSRIDMTGLNGSERLSLCSQFPELRFRIDDGQRKRIDANGLATPDDSAGYCTQEQLEWVRRLLGPQDRDHAREPARHNPVPQRRAVPRMPAATGGVSPELAKEPFEDRPMHAKPKDNCQHDWVRNSIGDGETCSRCQGFRRINPTRANIASRNAEARLLDMMEQAAICLRKRGRHFPVTVTGENGRALRICQFCGADVPEGVENAPGSPQAAV